MCGGFSDQIFGANWRCADASHHLFRTDWCSCSSFEESFGPRGLRKLSKLRRHLFEAYDSHYLRANELTIDGLNPDVYRVRLPEYEAAFGEIIGDLPTGSPVLDIGCGVGFLLYWLEHKRPGLFRLQGIDVSARQLQLAERNLASTVKLFHEDARDFLGRNRNKFATIFCTDLLEHIEGEDDLLEILERAKRALVPGGLFVCRVPNMANLVSMQLRYLDLTHVRGFTHLSLLQLLECAGFSECKMISRKAADPAQWLRMRIERLVHYIIYRICGVGHERHFARPIVGIGKA